jgi:hypothetical protein
MDGPPFYTMYNGTGNEHAGYVCEKTGLIETNIVNEDGTHNLV